MKNCFLIITCALLLGVLHAHAQMTVGNDLSMNLNGNASFGYTGDYGNAVAGSDHGVTFGGNGNLSGSYYNPSFLSFSFQPFYNQSRENSSFQSISNSSGFSASTSLFSGSHTPVSLTYSDTYNGQGNYAVPGVANYVSHGDSSALGVTWGLYLPDLPNLSFSYQRGSNTYSIYGANQNSSSTFDSFSASASYVLAGFNLNGAYRYIATNSLVPQVVTNQQAETSSSSGNSFSFGVGHKLPLNGAMSLGASRTDSSLSFIGGNTNSTVDTASGGVSFRPITNLNIGTNAQYLNNLQGLLDQTIISAGGVVQPTAPEQSSHSLDVTTFATYTMPRLHLSLNGSDERREQRIAGLSIASDSITGTASYSNYLFGGFFNVVGGATQNTVDTTNESSTGLIGSVNYTRQLQRWKLSGSGNYAQNTQTLLVGYTTSSYGYSGSLGRKLGALSFWSLNAAGSKSSLLNQQGSGVFSQSYSASLSLKRISLSGAYATSSGNAIVTATGLTNTPIPIPVVNPTLLTFYGGHSYSAAVGTNLRRGLTLSASYSKAMSNTLTNSISSQNSTDQTNVFMQYLFRKMWFTGGYSRLLQSFTAAGTLPTDLNSYYFGVTRWFNVF